MFQNTIYSSLFLSNLLNLSHYKLILLATPDIIVKYLETFVDREPLEKVKIPNFSIIFNIFFTFFQYLIGIFQIFFLQISKFLLIFR